MGKMVLFSAVRGTVLQGGKPVSGARIERKYKWGWNSETGTDGATTDVRGAFSLPRIERSSFFGSFLPHQPSVDQAMLIHHGGKTYEAWVLLKQNYDDNGELQGKPISLTCRLETPPEHGGPVYGICDID